MSEPLDGREARQGSRGRPMLYVLAAALVLSAIYFFGATMWSETYPEETIQEETGTSDPIEEDPGSGQAQPATEQPAQ